MRVLALVHSELGHSPGQRSSIELWRGPLEAAGISLTFAPFETKALHRVLGRRGYLLTKAWEMTRAYARRLRLLRSLEGLIVCTSTGRQR
jgi:hypothetical protein